MSEEIKRYIAAGLTLVKESEQGDLVMLEDHTRILSAERLKNDRLRKALNLNTAWPLTDVLKQLSSAAKTLLNHYNYDGHFHEEIRICALQADAILEALKEDKEVKE